MRKLESTIHILESYDQQKVDFVLQNFSSKSALELEAITTIDYVAVVMLKRHGSDREVLDKVQEIKGTKFSREYLVDNLNILKQFNYV